MPHASNQLAPAGGACCCCVGARAVGASCLGGGARARCVRDGRCGVARHRAATHAPHGGHHGRRSCGPRGGRCSGRESTAGSGCCCRRCSVAAGAAAARKPRRCCSAARGSTARGEARRADAAAAACACEGATCATAAALLRRPALCAHCMRCTEHRHDDTQRCSAAPVPPSPYNVRGTPSVRRIPARPPSRRRLYLRPCCADHDAMRRRGAPLALALALALCGAVVARPQCRLAVIGAGTPRTGSTHEMKVRRTRRACSRPAA